MPPQILAMVIQENVKLSLERLVETGMMRRRWSCQGCLGIPPQTIIVVPSVSSRDASVFVGIESAVSFASPGVWLLLLQR